MSVKETALSMATQDITLIFPVPLIYTISLTLVMHINNQEIMEINYWDKKILNMN